MKILILSDSHSFVGSVEAILQKEHDADMIVHLGDGADDMDLLREAVGMKPFVAVQGNCDIFMHELPTERAFTVEGVSFFVCHGHTRGVKNGLYRLLLAGKEKGCAVCLYGHTHIPAAETQDGILLFNPGAAAYGSYGLLTVKNGSVEARHCKL